MNKLSKGDIFVNDNLYGVKSMKGINKVRILFSDSNHVEIS